MIRNLILATCLFLCLSFNSANDERLIGTWKLVELAEGESIVKVDSPIKLVFSTEGKIGKFTGNTSKNLFSGLFDIKKKKEIKISGFMSTHMGDDEQSNEFLSKFSKISKYNLEGNELVLETVDQTVVLKFEKEDS